MSSILNTIGGPVILVGHSYGGAVITTAASGNRNVKALVYVAAFAPDTPFDIDIAGTRGHWANQRDRFLPQKWVEDRLQAVSARQGVRSTGTTVFCLAETPLNDTTGPFANPPRGFGTSPSRWRCNRSRLRTSGGTFHRPYRTPHRRIWGERPRSIRCRSCR